MHIPLKFVGGHCGLMVVGSKRSSHCWGIWLQNDILLYISKLSDRVKTTEPRERRTARRCSSNVSDGAEANSNSNSSGTPRFLDTISSHSSTRNLVHLWVCGFLIYLSTLTATIYVLGCIKETKSILESPRKGCRTPLNSQPLRHSFTA